MSGQSYTQSISSSLKLQQTQVNGVLELLEGGATIPFIARYRKEATGSLDEVAITNIRELHEQLVEIDKRRQSILDSLTKTEQLTAELKHKLAKADSLTKLEDIYLPYKPKRKTRAMSAREKGLEPLATAIFSAKPPQIAVSDFVNPEQGVATEEEALAGASDIIAEWIAEDQTTREQLRELFRRDGMVVSARTKQSAKSTKTKKNAETEAAESEKFRDYFDWTEQVSKAPGHRLLAMFRGEREKILSLTIRPAKESGLKVIRRQHLKPTRYQDLVAAALEDSYQRLLAPSLENELATELKSRADKEAIDVFAENLRQLLLAAPLGQKRVMALDPGYRTGAKLVCLDAQGQLLDHTTIYPTLGPRQQEQAASTVRDLVARHNVEAIAIGNGTAGRETESFIRALGLDRNIIITLVNEDGASIYSASESGRSEFGDLDLTVRGAVSIGRRLQDPLAELVKIDPKSIGVGQYQHDVNQAELKKKLDEVVQSCVNSVGVELNTASLELLTHVAGLGPVLAANIVNSRNQSGPFRSRRELLKVPRLGPKAYEQCAGFLRIRQGENPLDGSAVHPERYQLVGRMAKDNGLSLDQLLKSESAREKIQLKNYISDDVGLPTLADIMAELARPGRDPRAAFTQFHYAEGIHSMEDLHEGMSLPAIITNITKFGAFADIGIKQDGLIHISQLADRFIKDPSEVVKLGQHVTVRVVEIDIPRKRIGLSMRQKS